MSRRPWVFVMNGKKCWVFVTNVKKPWVFVTRRRTKFESSDKNSRFFNVSDKNSTFFAVSDKNSRSEGQNKFLPSRGTKIKTWGTTRNICTLPRDNTQKVLILCDNNLILKENQPQKLQKRHFAEAENSLSKTIAQFFWFILFLRRRTLTLT